MMSATQSVLDCLRRKGDPRLFTIMHALIYPGVLGSLMYALPDNWLKVEHKTNEALFLTFPFLSLPFFIAFICDYAHSVSEVEKPNYTNGRFICDLFIVFFLFCAGQRILGTKIVESVAMPWLMVGAKIAAVIWEEFKPKPSSTASAISANDDAIATDFIFVLVYGAIGIAAFKNEFFYLWLFGVALLADAYYYWVPSRP